MKKASAMKCPCGTDKLFAHCCALYINDSKQAESPEQLMRSRYSAYATYAIQYIYDTYAQSTKKYQSIADIESWAKECKWLALEVNQCSDYEDYCSNDCSNDCSDSCLNDCSEGCSNNYSEKNSSATLDTLPTVEFSAYYLLGNQLNKMHEISRFILEKISSKNSSQNVWRYLDDKLDHISTADNILIATIKQNDTCPCQSFKGHVIDSKNLSLSERKPHRMYQLILILILILILKRKLKS